MSIQYSMQCGDSIAGRKSGKGCYIYTGHKKSLNSQAENILKKFKIENKGRYVM